MFRKLITALVVAFALSHVGVALAESTASTDFVKQLKAENSILIKALTPEQLKSLQQPPELMMCGGSTPCNCRAGSYGYCTTAKECAEVGGTCS
ncbi:hypothetical protein ABT208_000517 [Escherichia coli]